MGEVAISEADAFEQLAQLGVNMDDYANAGNENISADDIQIPYINILQKLSPQVDEDHENHVEGAKPGMFFQNVNKALWDEPMDIVPVAFDRKVVEWVPREKGGGLVDVHPQSVLKEVEHKPNDRGVPVRVDNGNLLVDTATHYVMYRSPVTGEWEPAIISMKSSNHKKSRLWNSLIAQQKLPNGAPAPRWLHIWSMSTIKESKDDNTWYNFEFERAGIIDPEGFVKAETLYKGSREGLISGVGEDDSIPF